MIALYRNPNGEDAPFDFVGSTSSGKTATTTSVAVLQTELTGLLSELAQVRVYTISLYDLAPLKVM